MDPNGFIDLLMDFLAAAQVFGSKPTPNASGSQIGVQSVGELLVLCRVADEQGLELNPRTDQRSHVFNEVLGNAGPS
jgi:hypothetical protein